MKKLVIVLSLAIALSMTIVTPAFAKGPEKEIAPDYIMRLAIIAATPVIMVPLMLRQFLKRSTVLHTDINMESENQQKGCPKWCPFLLPWQEGELTSTGSFIRLHTIITKFCGK